MIPKSCRLFGQDHAATQGAPIASMPVRRSGLSLAIAAILLAGWTVGSRAQADEAYQPDPRYIEAAKKEAQVLLYTTHIVDQIVRPLIRGFQAHVGGIDVKYVRADGLQ